MVVQNDAFLETDSVTLCAFTHLLIGDAPLLRIDVKPSADNGLHVPSQIQVEKIVTVRRSDVDQIIGRLEEIYMLQLREGLRYFLDL